MADVVEGRDANPRAALIDHLRAFGGGTVTAQRWSVPHGWAPDGLSIAIMEPSKQYPWCNYATVGCWQAQKDCHFRSEFILSAKESRTENIQLIKMAAFFHLDPHYSIPLGKVLDVGHPWVDGSACTHLLASLPYPFGPYFEYPDVNPCTRYVWLVPITSKEAALADYEGVEALEQLFDANGIDFANPFRTSVVD